MKNNKSCFCSFACVDGHRCPNAQIEAVNDKYGYGIADDIGLEPVPCSKCRYNSGQCSDCIFQNTDYCSDCDNGVRK